MILTSVVLYLGFLFVSSVAAVKINLKESCGSHATQCTIADCNDDLLVIDSTDTSSPNLVEVAFRNCYSPIFPSAIFYASPKLERLLMYKCSLRTIQQRNFAMGNHLRSLYLLNNRLTELPEKVFLNLTKVEEIRLANNHIAHIHPKAFSNLTQLRLLELTNNKIHELAASVFNNLTHLEYIDLSFNNIMTISSNIFEKNLHLKTVLLNNNDLAVFESATLAHIPHLNVLDVSYNTISTLHLQSVDTLHVQSAQLRNCIVDGSVIKVRASNNQLKSISIADKASVKEIDVHGNQFESLLDFHGMLNLQKLDISKNPIRFLNSSNSSMMDLPSLQYLNVAYGQLQLLKVEQFALLTKLSHLDLAYNGLLMLDAGIFEPLAPLEKLYFEGNRLHLFDYEAFLQNHANIREIGIFGNEWSQPYLKKMSDTLRAHSVKLVVRFNPNEASDMLSLQTTSHPHHTVHSKTLDYGGHSSLGNNSDMLIIMTLCVVLIILILQLLRIAKDENMWNLFKQRVHRTNRSRRLDEEESEAL